MVECNMVSRDNSRFNGNSTSNFVNYFYKKFSDELLEEYTARSEMSASSYEKQDGLKVEGSCGKQSDEVYKYHLSDFLESYVDATQDTSKSFQWLNHIQKCSPVSSEDRCFLQQKTQPICNGLISWYNKESEFKKDILHHCTSQLGSETMFVHGILTWLHSQKIQPKLNCSLDRSYKFKCMDNKCCGWQNQI